MTAAELNAITADAAGRTARFELLTNQAETTGLVFDYSQPLPPLRTHRTRREWETQEEAQA
jgi:hypothetical protein